MADMLADGNVKVTFVPTIANKSVPTVTELTAGAAKDFQCLITADGLKISVDEDVVAIPKLCETVNSQAPGRATFQITLAAVRQSAAVDDIVWTTLLRNTAGFLVIRYGIAHSTAYAASQKVMVFPGKAGERRPNPVEANGAVTFDSQWYVNAQPDLDATVA